PNRRSLLARRLLALLLRQLPLAVVEPCARPVELRRRLLARPVARLQLAEASLGGLLLVGSHRLLRRQLGLQVRDPRVLLLDHFALVAHAPLALLELDLELRQLRLALVERCGAVRELLLRADVLVVGLRALLQLLAQRRLAGVRRLELFAQLL